MPLRHSEVGVLGLFLFFTIQIAKRNLWSVHYSNYRKHATCKKRIFEIPYKFPFLINCNSYIVKSITCWPDLNIDKNNYSVALRIIFNGAGLNPVLHMSAFIFGDDRVLWKCSRLFKGIGFTRPLTFLASLGKIGKFCIIHLKWECLSRGWLTPFIPYLGLHV